MIEHVLAAIGVIAIIAAVTVHILSRPSPQSTREQWEDKHKAAARGEIV